MGASQNTKYPRIAGFDDVGHGVGEAATTQALTEKQRYILLTQDSNYSTSSLVPASDGKRIDILAKLRSEKSLIVQFFA